MCLQVTFLIFLSFLSLITNLLASLSVPPSKHVLKSHLSSPQANLCHFSPSQANHLLQLVSVLLLLIHSSCRQQRNLLQLVLDLFISFPLFPDLHQALFQSLQAYLLWFLLISSKSSHCPPSKVMVLQPHRRTFPAKHFDALSLCSYSSLCLQISIPFLFFHLAALFSRSAYPRTSASCERFRRLSSSKVAKRLSLPLSCYLIAVISLLAFIVI